MPRVFAARRGQARVTPPSSEQQQRSEPCRHAGIRAPSCCDRTAARGARSPGCSSPGSRRLAASDGGEGSATGGCSGATVAAGPPPPLRPPRRRGRRPVRRGRLLPVFAVRHRLAELADAVAERFGQIGEAFRAEHEQRHSPEEQQMNRVLDPHRDLRLPLRRLAARNPPVLPIRSRSGLRSAAATSDRTGPAPVSPAGASPSRSGPLRSRSSAAIALAGRRCLSG